MGRRRNPVNLKSNTMKNTMQRYAFYCKLQETSTKNPFFNKNCSFLLQ